MALRPEAVTLGSREGAENALDGRIEEVTFLGSVVGVRFAENTISLDTFNQPGNPPPSRGDRVAERFLKRDLLVLDEA